MLGDSFAPDRCNRVLAGLAGYPNSAAATRFRLYQLRDALARHSISLRITPYLNETEFQRFYSGSPLRRVGDALSATGRSVLRLTQKCDAVLVHREATLFGPAFVERVVGRNRPLILDFDDAIWTPVHHGLKGAIRNTRKFDWLFRRADALIAGSNYLLEEGKSRARPGIPTIVAPTVVPAATWTPKTKKEDAIPTIGWVGTHSTAVSLRQVEPALRRLRARGHRFTVRLVGAGSFRFDELEATYDDWSLRREKDDFASMDIGLGPMLDELWWYGKCGFKQVQFATVGVPTVSSPVGAVCDVVRENETGLFARSDAEWETQLERLLVDHTLRQQIGTEARRFAESTLSAEVMAPRVASFVDSVLRR